MKKKRGTPVQKAEENLREIFRGIYFRHEFARRNGRVMRKSKEILKVLGLDMENVRPSLLGDNGTPLLTEQIRQTIGLTEPDVEKTRALRKFLRTYRVLPVSVEKGTPFFPFPPDTFTEEDFQKFTDLWNLLLRFEAFALSVIRVGSPVFFPVMMLGVVDARGKSLSVAKRLDLANYRFAPVVADFSVPWQILGAYMGMLRSQARLTRPRATETGVEDDPEVTSNRWTKYEFYLRAYDFKRPLHGKVGEAKADIVRQYEIRIGETPDDEASVSKDNIERRRRNFDNWRAAAKRLIKIKGYCQVI